VQQQLRRREAPLAGRRQQRRLVAFADARVHVRARFERRAHRGDVARDGGIVQAPRWGGAHFWARL